MFGVQLNEWQRIYHTNVRRDFVLGLWLTSIPFLGNVISDCSWYCIAHCLMNLDVDHVGYLLPAFLLVICLGCIPNIVKVMVGRSIP